MLKKENRKVSPLYSSRLPEHFILCYSNSLRAKPASSATQWLPCCQGFPVPRPALGTLAASSLFYPLKTGGAAVAAHMRHRLCSTQFSLTRLFTLGLVRPAQCDVTWNVPQLRPMFLTFCPENLLPPCRDPLALLRQMNQEGWGNPWAVCVWWGGGESVGKYTPIQWRWWTIPRTISHGSSESPQ